MVKKLWSTESHSFIKVLLTPQLTKIGIFFKGVWGDFLTGIMGLLLFTVSVKNVTFYKERNNLMYCI